MKIEVGKHYKVLSGSGVLFPGDVIYVIAEDEYDSETLFLNVNRSLIARYGRASLAEMTLEEVFKAQGTPSKPAHYDTGIDTIAFMRANCPPEQVEGFLRGNALKYLQRYPNKNGVDDLRKAKHYVEMLIEELEGRG